MNQSIFKGSYHIDKEILQLNFDDLIESDIVKIIPVLRAINALYKGGLGIRDRFFMKKMVFFINQFNSGLSTQEIQRFVLDVLTDEKFRERVTEKILILLDRFDDEFKALILAELIKNWIKKNIDWNTFERLAYSVDRAHPSVFIGLYDYYKNYDIVSKTGAGIYHSHKPLIIGSGFGFMSSGPISRLVISEDALDICEYGLKEILDDQYEILPRGIIEHLQTVRIKGEKLLNNSIFSDYEQGILELALPDSISNFKIRKEILENIRKCYSV